MRETIKVSKLLEAIAKEYDYDLDYSDLYDNLILSFVLIEESPLQMSGKMFVEECPPKVFEDKEIEIKGPLLFSENRSNDTWTIQEYGSLYELEEIILDRMTDDENSSSMYTLYAYFDGKIQEYTFGQILEDGRRIEVDWIDETTPDIQLYWVKDGVIFEEK